MLRINIRGWRTRSLVRILAFSIVTIILVSIISTSAFAQEYSRGDEAYKNPDTGYVVLIVDDEDLLTDSEEELLLEDMKPITEYGNAAFVSTYATGSSTSEFAANWYYSTFGNDSGTTFVIDMYNRNIYIVSAGEVYKTITKGYANTITDNVYRYASRGDYYGCASEAFKQGQILLEGGRIARPMKHITNGLVALIGAILINYIVAMRQRKNRETPTLATFAATTASTLSADVLDTKFIKSVTYSESSDDGGSFSGGGGGFSGGGGGGGGGFSGGGGGHSF